MSPPVGLAGVKKGDVVVVTSPYARGDKVARCPVTAIGRKYLTAGGREFFIEDGTWKGKGYSYHHHAYTIAQWEHREAVAALRGAIDRLRATDVQARTVTPEQACELTAQISAIADRLAGGAQ